MATSHRELALKLAVLEERVSDHDDELQEILVALRKLITPAPKQRRRIGF